MTPPKKATGNIIRFNCSRSFIQKVYHLSMKRVQILGVPIDPVSLEEAVSRIMSMVNDGAKHHVMTPNSEMLIEAHGNVPFKTLLRSNGHNSTLRPAEQTPYTPNASSAIRPNPLI